MVKKIGYVVGFVVGLYCVVLSFGNKNNDAWGKVLEDVNLRKTESLNSQIVQVLKKGTEVKILSVTNSGRAHIEIDDNSGYINNKYLKSYSKKTKMDFSFFQSNVFLLCSSIFLSLVFFIFLLFIVYKLASLQKEPSYGKFFHLFIFFISSITACLIGYFRFNSFLIGVISLFLIAIPNFCLFLPSYYITVLIPCFFSLSLIYASKMGCTELMQYLVFGLFSIMIASLAGGIIKIFLKFITRIK